METIETTAIEDDATISLDAPRRRLRLQRWQRRRLARVGMAATAGIGLLLTLLYLWPGFLVPTDAISKIAVMPLTERIEDPDEAYFSQGITDDLIASLTKTRVVTVISRRSAALAQERYATPAEIARHLRVHALMEGTVQRIGDRLRMSLQLVQPFTGAVLWADSFEAQQRDVFALQNQIAQALAAAVAPEHEALSDEAPALEVDPEAYALVLKAKYYADKWTAEGFDKSIEYLEAAIDREPEWAEPYGRLAIIRVVMAAGFGGEVDPELQYKEAKRLVEEGLRLDPGDAVVQTGVASVAQLEGQLFEAFRGYEGAVAADPSFADAWSEGGWLLSYVRGQEEKAVEWTRQAEILDPLAPMVFANAGVAYANIGRYDEAIAAFQEALELNPDFWNALTCLGQLYLVTGRNQEGFRLLSDMFERGLNRDQDLQFLGIAYARLGRVEDAQRILQECQQSDPSSEPDSTAAPYLSYELGDTERAKEVIVTDIENSGLFAVFSLGGFWGDAYPEIRNDPRVARVLDEIESQGASIADDEQ